MNHNRLDARNGRLGASVDAPPLNRADPRADASGDLDGVTPAPVEFRRTLTWRARQRVSGLAAAAGVFMLAGLFAALLGVAAFSALTDRVLDGGTARFDRAVLHWLENRTSPGLDRAAADVTALGDTLVVLVLAGVAAVLLWLLGRRAYAALLLMAVGGASIISPLLKTLFDRPRPPLAAVEPTLAETSAAYPSGHATLSTVTFLAIAFIIHRLSRRRFTAWMVALLAGTAIILTGLSRLYLGVHYPSDVLAGYLVGFAWLVLCAWLLPLFQQIGAPASEGMLPHRTGPS